MWVGQLLIRKVSVNTKEQYHYFLGKEWTLDQTFFQTHFQDPQNIALNIQITQNKVFIREKFLQTNLRVKLNQNTFQIITTPFVFWINQGITLKLQFQDYLLILKIFSPDQKCSICLNEDIQDFTVTKCRHLFCSQCLYSWLERSSHCPFCKQNIDHLYIQKDFQFETVQVQQKDFELKEEWLEAPCYVCLKNDHDDQLLLCDFCSIECCHTYCLDPPINFIPDEDWYCYKCIQENNF